MKKWRNTFLLPGECIMDEITASFEVQDSLGITEEFGKMIATNKRLIFYTNDPSLESNEMLIYHYEEVNQTSDVTLEFSFSRGTSFAIKFVDKGNAKLFLSIITLFANFPLCTREKELLRQ